MIGLKFSKRLQLITISPLILGIIICAIVCVSIMFNEHIQWLNKSHDDLVYTEMQNLNSNSKSFSESFSTLLNTVTSTVDNIRPHASKPSL